MTSMTMVMVALVIFVGVVLAATPWLMPPTECFTVTVPPSAQRDARVRGYKRSYAAVIAVVTLVCAAGMGMAMQDMVQVSAPTDEQLMKLTGVILLTTFVPIVVGMALMLRFRARVQELKRAEGWHATAQRSVAVVGDDAPRPLPLTWNLLYVPLVLGMVIFALTSYERFPEQIPMKVDFTGNVISYAPRSWGSVLYPAMVTTFLGLVFTMSHAALLISKRPIDPVAPATSAFAYGRFVRLQSAFLLAGGLVIGAVTGVCFYLATLGMISMMRAAVLVTVAALLFALGMMGVSVVTGQAGGRLAAQLRTSDELGRDDDAFWPLGIFYYNADDPSVVVPKRFGVGWTINCARPAAWVAMGLLLALVIGFVLLIEVVLGL